MRFRQFVHLIAIGLQARIPMHMTGFPGVGKTEFTKSLEAGFARVRRWDWRATEHAGIDDYSQAYLPHMDKENGTLVSLNLEAIA